MFCSHNLLNMFSRYFATLFHQKVPSSFQGERLIICCRAKSAEVLTEITYAYHRLDLRVDVEWKSWEGNLCSSY